MFDFSYDKDWLEKHEEILNPSKKNLIFVAIDQISYKK